MLPEEEVAMAALTGIDPYRHGPVKAVSDRRFLLLAFGLVLALGCIPQTVRATPFTGSISWTAFNTIPTGWARCDGALLPINSNFALFALLGTTYGGDGRTNFALPDIRSRTILHSGPSHRLGESGGAYAHTLTSAEMASHQHRVTVSKGGSFSTSGQPDIPYDGTVFVAESPTSIFTDATGAEQAHENEQPTLVLNCIIAVSGLFPARN